MAQKAFSAAFICLKNPLNVNNEIEGLLANHEALIQLCSSCVILTKQYKMLIWSPPVVNGGMNGTSEYGTRG